MAGRNQESILLRDMSSILNLVKNKVVDRDDSNQYLKQQKMQLLQIYFNQGNDIV